MTVQERPAAADVVHLMSGGPIETHTAEGQTTAVAWSGTTILATGAAAIREATQREAAGVSVDYVDLDGRFAMPAFVDAHNHLSISALTPRCMDASAMTSIDELLDALRTFADERPEAAWLRVTDYDDRRLGAHPLARDLDRAVPDRPVVCAHYSLHQAAVNGPALAALGLGRDTPDPRGGKIERYEDGTPNGRLIERASAEADWQARRWMVEHCGYEDLIAAEGQRLLRLGITAVHDAAVGPAALLAYQRLAAAGRLPVSVLAMPHDDALLATPPNGLELVTGEGTAQLRVGPVKLFADGGSHPSTRKELKDGSCVHRGHAFHTRDDLRHLIESHARQGFDVAVHAMGNLGLQTVLDALGDVPHPPSLRVEHATLAEPAQVEALRAAGVTVCVQPGFVETMGASLRPWPNATWLPFRDYLEAGIEVAAGTDQPCGPDAPFVAMAHGASRRTTSGTNVGLDQAVSISAWMRAFTDGAARSGGQGDERGSLRRGLRADIVVVRTDPRKLSPEDVGRLEVEETWAGGTLAYRRAATGPR